MTSIAVVGYGVYLFVQADARKLKVNKLYEKSHKEKNDNHKRGI